jgi:ferrous iron transport protein B
MHATTQTRTQTVALIGNPNTGKSTLFSDLVGVRQQVGNYPGVTVEKKTGRLDFAGRSFEIIDLPGLYSLAPRSRDEMVAVDLLVGRRRDVPPIDAVLCIVDASNLQRNLYLVSQVLEVGLPTVVAVNMLDVAEGHGIKLDLAKLERHLGVPVTPVQANRSIGLAEVKTLLARAVRKEKRSTDGAQASQTSDAATPAVEILRPDPPEFPPAFEKEVDKLEAELAAPAKKHAVPRWLLRRLLLDVNGYLQQAILHDRPGDRAAWLEASRARLTSAGCPIPTVETDIRYDWARRVLDGVLIEPKRYKTTATDRIDRVLTHRFWGMAVFVLVMLAVFQSVFVGARPAMEWIQVATAAIGGWVESSMAAGALRSLLVDGVIGGVGGVLVFLPQILVLFAFLAVLEDCGYMARSAYLMDRVMARIGLSGKSFIPLLSSFACAVPGIMATRVIENERDRLTTILVAPLLTCSARLPVYAMLIAAFIPSQAYFGGLLNLQGLTLAGLYLLGILMAVLFALLFKRTLLRGQRPPFVMELPSYKWPSPRTVSFRMVERGWTFVRCAGTLILAVSILVWAALYYPHHPGATHQEQQRDSFLGQAGRVIEPVVRPLGWDWRIGCAVIASLPAREIVVATMGVMYHMDEDGTDHTATRSAAWGEKLRSVTWEGTDRPVFNVPVALSIMVFFALCAQCAATLAVIRRETNSWRWPAFTFGYMTLLAYAGAWTTYQLGMWLG